MFALPPSRLINIYSKQLSARSSFVRIFQSLPQALSYMNLVVYVRAKIFVVLFTVIS